MYYTQITTTLVFQTEFFEKQPFIFNHVVDQHNFTSPEMWGHPIERGSVTLNNYFVHSVNGRIVYFLYIFIFKIVIKNVHPGCYSLILPLFVGTIFNYTFQCKNPTFFDLKTSTYWPSLRHCTQCKILFTGKNAILLRATITKLFSYSKMFTRD